MRIAVSLVLLLVLSACRYESTADLRPSVTQYKPTGAFPVGEYVFQSRDQSELLVLEVKPDDARIAYQNQGQSPLSDRIIAILGSDRWPEKVYVAMAEGGTDKQGAQTWHYYPFSFNEQFIGWMKPASPVQVFGLADLAQHITAAEQAGGSLALDRVAPEQAPAVLARFENWRKNSKQAPATPAPGPAPTAPPPAATPPTVKGFSVGDGVYVQGFLSDKPSIIQEIDQANRRVKVRRYDDGVSEWVGFDSIISRNESTVNDVARTGAFIGVMVCAFSPETCKPTQK